MLTDLGPEPHSIHGVVSSQTPDPGFEATFYAPALLLVSLSPGRGARAPRAFQHTLLTTIFRKSRGSSVPSADVRVTPCKRSEGLGEGRRLFPPGTRFRRRRTRRPKGDRLRSVEDELRRVLVRGGNDSRVRPDESGGVPSSGGGGR